MVFTTQQILIDNQKFEQKIQNSEEIVLTAQNLDLDKTPNLPKMPDQKEASSQEGYYGSDADLSKVEECKIDVDGIMINYAKAGHGAHNVLCLPGSLGAWHTDFAPTLADFDHDKFTIVSLDPPGYGKSRPPIRQKTINSNQYDAKYAHQLMVNLELIPYSLVGWSDGGATALVMAGTAKMSPHVRSVTTTGATAYITEKMANIYKVLMTPSSLSSERQRAYATIYDDEYLGMILKQHMESRIEIFQQRKGNKCIDILGNIKCPVLILHGGKDPLVADEHPQFLCKNIKNSRQQTKHAGDHSLHLQYHDWYKRNVQRFLDNVAAGTA